MKGTQRFTMDQRQIYYFLIAGESRAEECKGFARKKSVKQNQKDNTPHPIEPNRTQLTSQQKSKGAEDADSADCIACSRF